MPPVDPSALILETFKVVIASGQNALRAAMLVNGGAAVALLALLGNIVTKTESDRVLKGPLPVALLFFGLGVFMSAVASALVYFAQVANARQVEAAVKIIEASAQQAAGFRDKAEHDRREGLRRNSAAIWCGVLSLAFFLFGLLLALWGFWALGDQVAPVPL
jgi:hypothetical protein